MKRYIFSLTGLIIINITVVFVTVFIAGVFFKYDPAVLLLTDDGYYNLSKDFFEGTAIVPNILAPGIPIIYSAIHFFPQAFHPFLRLLISVMFSSGIIVLAYYSLQSYLNKKELFIGSILFIINPVYVQWTIKSCPEIYVGFFLALFIYLLLKTTRSGKLIFPIILGLILFISFFIKPVFIFIPPTLLIYYIFIRNKRLIITSIILSVLAVIGFYLYTLNTPKVDNQARLNGQVQYGEYNMITSSLWINWVVKTGQYYKPTVKPYKIPSDLNRYFPPEQLWLYEKIGSKAQLEDASLRYVIYYYNNHPNGNLLGLNIQFIMDYPDLFIQKLMLSPLFFLGMSVHGTFVKLFYSLLLSILGIISILKIVNGNNKIDIISIGTILFGYSILYLLTHAYDRYSLPVLPWITIWSGYIICRYLEEMKKQLNSKLLV